MLQRWVFGQIKLGFWKRDLGLDVILFIYIYYFLLNFFRPKVHEHFHSAHSTYLIYSNCKTGEKSCLKSKSQN